MQRGSQLAFNVFGDLQHFGFVAAAHDQRAWSEDLGFQCRVGEEGGGIHLMQGGLRRAWHVGGQALAQQLHAFLHGQRAHTGHIGFVDAWGQHGRCALGLQRGDRTLDELLQRRAIKADDQAWIGAELARAHGQRINKLLRQRGAFQCARQQEYRIDAAHFSVDRNRLGACSGGAYQRQPALT